MGKKAQPPENYALGRERGIETRKQRSAQHDKLTWHFINAIALGEKPTTLRGFAEELNTIGFPAANGGEWTVQKVGNVFRRHGTSAKELTAKVNQPPAYVTPPKPARTAQSGYRKSIERLDQPSEQNGLWRSATEISPSCSDIVRHTEFGVGQCVNEERLGRFRCRFIDDEHGSFDAQIPASNLEVFRFHLSREERQRLADSIAEKWL